MTERVIRMTAKELAGAFFEQEHSDRFRKMWPKVNVFINRNWPTFVPMAREILVSQLHDKNTPEHLKKVIYEAIIEDREKSTASAGAKVGRGQLFLNPDHPGELERKIFHDK